MKCTSSNYSDHFECLIYELMASVTWSVVVLLVTVDGINVVVECDYGTSLSNPGKFCLDIYHKNSHGVSGQCIIKVVSLYHFIYYDMKLECEGEKRWMRIANIKINVGNGDSCPSG